MIRTRLIVGTGLALAAGGVLVGDSWFSPWYWCLLACLLFTGVFATLELVRLFPAAMRPPELLAVSGVVLMLAANWVPVIHDEAENPLIRISPWGPVLTVFLAVLLIGFLVEMAQYEEPGTAVPRLGLLVLTLAYIGLLGSCFAQIRWLADTPRSGLMLTLTIFVPKVGDIGAFFTGRFLGRHKMTPVLSPKKTWEGLAGGLLAAVLAAMALSSTGNVFKYGLWEAAAFGFVVGGAGVLGDLAESLIKRDCQTKDSGQSIPGFGGLLDVIDSVLFAAPIALLWFTL